MTEQVPKFAPREIAVFVHQNGAREFEVETTTFHGDMQRVHEYYIQPGDTETRYSQYGGPGTPYTSLIKIADPDVRRQAVELINARAEEGRKLISKATEDARRMVAQAVLSVRNLAGDEEGG